MSDRRTAIFGWSLFGLIAAAVVAATIFNLVNPPGGKPLPLQDHLWSLVPLTFAFVGALITSRQPRNVIGLLLILPGLLFAVPVETYLRQFPIAPEAPSLLLLLTLWFNNWSWLLLIWPILFIILFFPTGRPPGPGWRWVTYLGLGMGGLLVLFGTFAREWGPISVEDPPPWTVRNPLGFIPNEFEPLFLAVWFVALPTLTLLCAASVFVRYRRARAIEREQIKWLLYAGAFFVAVYVPSFFGGAFFVAEPGTLGGYLFILAILAIPTAVGIAVLRYRLYDIDVIIRRTLQYALLTGLLALVYFGGVVALQRILGPLTGQANSPIVVTIATLAIAALFNPLRIRVQRFIDRRFYRKRYDAEQTLTRFAAMARDEVDLDTLTSTLLGVVNETVQPTRVGLWLKPTETTGRKRDTL